MVTPRIGGMRGNGTASGETGIAPLSTLPVGGAASAGLSKAREVLSARRKAARFRALVSGSNARSRVWPTTSTGLAVFVAGFGVVAFAAGLGVTVLGLRL